MVVSPRAQPHDGLHSVVEAPAVRGLEIPHNEVGIPWVNKKQGTGNMEAWRELRGASDSAAVRLGQVAVDGAGVLWGVDFDAVDL